MAEKYHAKHHIKTAAPKALAIALAAVLCGYNSRRKRKRGEE